MSNGREPTTEVNLKHDHPLRTGTAIRNFKDYYAATPAYTFAHNEFFVFRP